MKHIQHEIGPENEFDNGKRSSKRFHFQVCFVSLSSSQWPGFGDTCQDVHWQSIWQGKNRLPTDRWKIYLKIIATSTQHLITLYSCKMCQPFFWLIPTLFFKWIWRIWRRTLLAKCPWANTIGWLRQFRVLAVQLVAMDGRGPATQCLSMPYFLGWHLGGVPWFFFCFHDVYSSICWIFNLRSSWYIFIIVPSCTDSVIQLVWSCCRNVQRSSQWELEVPFWIMSWSYSLISQVNSIDDDKSCFCATTFTLAEQLFKAWVCVFVKQGQASACHFLQENLHQSMDAGYLAIPAMPPES